VDLADEHGLEALTMRRLAGRLDVEAMSLYNHVADKDDLIDGMVELIATEFEVPTGTSDWKGSMRTSARSTHAVLLRHPWASVAMESRAWPGPVRLRLLDTHVGTLTDAGFSMSTIIRTLMALDAHTFGFALQEVAWPFPSEAAAERAVEVADELSADEYPNVASMLGFVATSRPGDLVDFEFGLELMLDALERQLSND
jgi:AcrR family transcriptional regulator